MPDEEHEETVIYLGEGGLGLGHEFLLVRLDFITVHIVHFLGRNMKSITALMMDAAVTGRIMLEENSVHEMSS